MANTLLVIDDSSTIREAVELSLTGAEWETLSATGGEQAATVLQRHRVDAILCDVAPGEEDGYELCRSLGASTAATGVPIVLMGGNVNATAALAVGASSTLPKPFASEQLLKTLAEVVEQSDFSFDFDDVPVETTNHSPGELGAMNDEFTLETTSYADGDLDIEEIEVIDLSDDGEFEDLELLDDLQPVELPAAPAEPQDAGFALDFDAPVATSQDAPAADGPLLDWDELPSLDGKDSALDLESLDVGSAQQTDPVPLAADEGISEPETPEEPLDLAAVLGGTEDAPAESMDGSFSAGEPTDGAGPDELPVVATSESFAGEAEGAGVETADMPPPEGEPEIAFEDREISFDAFDADLLPEAGATVVEPGPDEDQPAEWEALDAASLPDEVSGPDTPSDDLAAQPDSESAAPMTEEMLPGASSEGSPGGTEWQPSAPVVEEEKAAAADGWEVLTDDGASAPEWDAALADAIADLTEPQEPSEAPPIEAALEVVEASAPGWEPADAAIPSSREPQQPSPDPSVLRAQADLAADVAAGAGLAVREALERSLSAEQLAPMIAAAVERVAWEIVPQLAERLIRETIEKLQQDPPPA